jgi:hypothetical protein
LTFASHHRSTTLYRNIADIFDTSTSEAANASEPQALFETELTTEQLLPRPKGSFRRPRSPSELAPPRGIGLMRHLTFEHGRRTGTAMLLNVCFDLVNDGKPGPPEAAVAHDPSVPPSSNRRGRAAGRRPSRPARGV